MLAKLALSVLLLGTLASALTSPTGVPLSTSGRHPMADIFNGGFAFVNTSTFNGSVWLNTAGGKIGNIIYAPAYPGALYGTMGVDYGHVFNSSAYCIDVLTDFSGYTGAYRAFPNNGTVQHYPIVSSNPINGHTQANTIAQRFVYRMDDDNTVALGQDPSSSLLFWTRNFRFPAPAGEECTGSVTVSLLSTGSTTSFGKTTYTRTYEVFVFNLGDLALETVAVDFNLASNITVSSVVGLNSALIPELVTVSPNAAGSYPHTFGLIDPESAESPLTLPIFTITVSSPFPMYASSISAGLAPANVACYPHA